MINTLVFRNGDNLGCHVVGLVGCLSITEVQHDSIGEFESYSYEAVYTDRIEKITDVILATDVKLI